LKLDVAPGYPPDDVVHVWLGDAVLARNLVLGGPGRGQAIAKLCAETGRECTTIDAAVRAICKAGTE
jgi:hypothetical protein